MVGLMYAMMMFGGLVALVGGVVLLVFGDRLAERDRAAGRRTQTPEQQRRFAWMFTGIGVAALLFAFIL